jgi:pimeloyl-ACP methyl ester carboxylesterase
VRDVARAGRHAAKVDGGAHARRPALRDRGLVEPAVAAPRPQPALVVAGEDDPSVPLRNGRVLAARLPDARLHVVKGGGHLFLLDEPESVAGVIRDFLNAP